MLRRAFFLLTLVASCGGGTAVDSPATPGTAQLTIRSLSAGGGTSVPSFRLQAAFVRPGGEASCATTKIGTCTITPCFVPATTKVAGVTDAGQVSVANAATSGAIEPTSDSTYSNQTFGGALWMTSGESITFQWAHFPGSASEAGSTVVMQTPAYVTLSPGSPFASATSAVSRTSDLTLAWTGANPAASGDEVAVSLIAGSTQVDCIFDASSGTGVVQAAALQSLGAGAGTFDIHSKTFSRQNVLAADGSSWVFSFNVDASARTTDGLASGAVMFE